MSLLTVTSLTKIYKETPAVNNIDFSLSTGKCIALIGPNGAGKTTILRILAGLLKPTKGEIVFTDQPKKADYRSLIGYLPQYPVFPDWMSAKEFLLFSGELSGLSKQQSLARAEQLVEQVGIKDAWEERISGYSGGMKQRLGIAQAIIHSPKLLLLDEPVASLDPIGRREVLNLLEQLKASMTILFSTHILNDAEEVCDELLLLNKGEIIEAGSLEQLRETYQTSVIELEFQEEPEKYLEHIKALPSGKMSYLERGTVMIPTSEIETVRAEIFQAALEHQWPLLRFQLNRESLEELFLKAVKK